METLPASIGAGALDGEQRSVRAPEPSTSWTTVASGPLGATGEPERSAHSKSEVATARAEIVVELPYLPTHSPFRAADGRRVSTK